MEKVAKPRPNIVQLNFMLPIDGSRSAKVTASNLAIEETRNRLMSDLQSVGLRKPTSR
jgi:hypothetical protein